MISRILPIPLSLLLSVPLARAVDAEGVTEDKTINRTLQPYDRKADTTPADSAAAAQKGFRRAKIPAGFKADLWASEPMLANPVAFSFDGKGRMFIAETHRYRTSVLDIRHYMFMLEDDLANRNQTDWERSIKKNFPNDWQELGKETEVIRLVEDTNGDGKADKTSVYADGFNSILDGIASGVLARPDGVWVTNIPGLYKLSGQGADGKAEKKEEVFRGFGVRFSYTGHDLHGLIKGPDGRLYFSIGDRGASVKTKEGGTIEVPDEGAIFRCEEDGSHLELVMRGLRNPQELAFDDYGNLFTCDNDSDQGDRERLVYVVEGGDAGWRVGYQHCPQPAERNPWLAEHMWEPRDPSKNQPASILSPVANLPDGPGGLVHYPGTGLPEKYNGCFFLACYKGSSQTSQVAVFKPVPDGAGFKLEMLETFIPGCQATDVDFGPDSRMYVSFWDEGWERTAQGRIMKVEHEEARKAQAAQIAEVQKLLGDGMKNRSAEELMKLLGHKDQRVRLEAQWELAGRVLDSPKTLDASIEWKLLVEATHAKDGSTLARLHSIWAAGHIARVTFQGDYTDKQQGLLAFESDLRSRKVFSGPQEEVRVAWAWFFNQLPRRLNLTESMVLNPGLYDKSERVRAAVVQALGSYGDNAQIHSLINFARREPHLRQEMLHILAKAIVQQTLCYSVPAEALLTLGQTDKRIEPYATTLEPVAVNDGRLHVRMLMLHVAAELATMAKNEPARVTGTKIEDAAKLVGSFLADSDAAISREAAWLITDRGLAGAEAQFATGKVTATDTMTTLRHLNAMNGKGLAEFASNIANDTSLRTEAWRLLQLASPSKATGVMRDQTSGVYRPRPLPVTPGFDGPGWNQTRNMVLKHAPASLLAQRPIAMGALEAMRLWAPTGEFGPVFAKDVKALALDAKADRSVRSYALRVLYDVKSEVLPEVLKSAITDPSSTVRIAAAGLLGKTDPAAASKALESALSQGTPEDARAAFTELAALPGAEADRILTEQLAALAAGKVPAIAKLELLEAAAKREAPAVKEALAKYEAALPKEDALAKFAVCLEGGDTVKGQAVFKSHAVAACTRCHIVNKSGGEAGPPLDGIAAQKDARYLLESVVAPNAQIAESFRMVVVSMKDGGVKSGVLRAETPESITIQTPGEEPETVKTADIASRDAVPSSMLPNLGDLLTKREIRDIMAYLGTLK